MRRKQGPPKVSDVPLEGQQCQTGAGQECHHTARCQQKETGAVSCKHASKDESGISEACENHARKMRTFFTRRLEPKTKSSNAFKWSLRPKRK